MDGRRTLRLCCLGMGRVPGWRGASMEEGPADSQVTSSRKEGQRKASSSYNCSATWLYELGRELGEKGGVCCSNGWRPCVQGEIA